MDRAEIEKRALAFDDYAQHDENGVEYWYARDLMPHLGYARWENFSEAIRRAILACETSKSPVRDHFRGITKMVKAGVASIPRQDYMLTRYACYLIAMNGDPRKDEIAFAQSYFAIATRTQELIEQRIREVQRLHSRETLKESEKRLATVAFERGVDQRGFARIKSMGGTALFGGNDTRAMKKRLGVPEKSPLADYLPDVSIAAKNLANSMTTHNVEHDDLHGIGQIAPEHVANNESVRASLTGRGIVPENLPPEEDTEKLQRCVKADERKIKSGKFPSMEDNPAAQ